ncbi:MAG: DUF2723 domain-containing protein [Gemmatimonadales bacterium]|nr:DUF2723 domain-containing protein [Gemmatimonadales bacterium]NIN10838.1 DUF2723 domain-containing protein [Gemmatimonadales bacterium]NIN49481.1 DUF2723 domain-containing protein [Gemmatimonadales bacterium]NIP06945.1 DUF2723 domain-containing protein [Gemmatimonadales bacterium]NIR01621.1 DUF2723 domain-containing protein [Gemmatimonadales bacterium]
MTDQPRGQSVTDSGIEVRAEGPPYLVAALVSVAVLALYVATIAPSTQFWDTSEYIAAAKVLGIPHPPGNPLFVILARVWGEIPMVAHYALRINLLSAVASALASGFLFLVAERFLREIVPHPRWARLSAAFGGVLVGATSFTVWNQSVVNEKVYTLSLLSIALVLWLVVHWGDQPAGERRDHWLLLIVYLVALSATNHLMGLLAIPALLIYAEAAEAEDNLWERLFGAAGLLGAAGVAGYLGLRWWDDHAATAYLVLSVLLFAGTLWLGFRLHASQLVRMGLALASAGVALLFAVGAWPDRQPLPMLAAMLLLALLLTFAFRSGNGRPVLMALGVVAVGVSVWAVLPIRASHFPAINEGEPTTLDAFLAVLSREQYQKGPLIPRQAELLWQYANYIQYFTWQFANDWGLRARDLLALLFAGLGIAGAVRHWQRDRRGALAMTALMVTVTLLLVFYLDFKYGYSVRPGENLLREVRERDYFFIASFQLWGIWVALGLGTILEAAARALPKRIHVTRRWALCAPLLLIALIPFWGNRLTASRADEMFPRDFAWDLLQSVEPYAILITAGDNDQFPLWYMQEVEGVRRDILVANTSLMNTLWHTRQLKRREIFPFDSANAIPLYRDRTWPRPTEPPLSLSYEQINALPALQRTPEGRLFNIGGLRVALPEVLERQQIVTLWLIRENLGKRPIYFSHTAGGQPDVLGLTPYLLGQGLVRKLMSDTIEAQDGIVAMRGLGWVDTERSKTLLFDLYHAESAARERPRGWVDEPSQGVLSLYALLYASMGEHLALQALTSTVTAADTLNAAKASQLAERMFRQTSVYR